MTQNGGKITAGSDYGKLTVHPRQTDRQTKFALRSLERGSLTLAPISYGVESDLGNKVCTCAEATGTSVLAVTDRVVINVNCSILSTRFHDYTGP